MERNAQVELMAEIYSRSYSLLVWLGESDEHSTRALGLIEKLGKKIEYVRESEADLPQWICQSNFADPQVFEHFGLEPFTTDDWLSIAHFLQRTWFNRVWTIQEYCLPMLKRVLCGRKHQPLIHLTAFSNFMTNAKWVVMLLHLAGLPKDEPFGCNLLMNAAMLSPRLDGMLDSRLCRQYGASHNDPVHRVASYAAYAVAASRRREAGDSRDKVIALLALASKFQSPTTRLVPLPDYSKSTNQVYVDFVQYVLSVTSRLAILSQVETPEESSNPGLPSWVSDYRCKRRDFFDTFAMSMKGSASKEEIAPCIKVYMDRELELRGYYLTQVTQTCQADLRRADYDCLSLLRFAKETHLGLCGSNWIEPFLHTMTASALTAASPHTLRDSFEHYLCWKIFTSKEICRPGARFGKYDDVTELMNRVHNYKSHIVSLCSGSVLSPRSESLEAILAQIEAVSLRLRGTSNFHVSSDQERYNLTLQQEPLSAAIASATYWRRLLRTDISAIGLGPQGSMAGDEVWIFPGSKVPILLRSTAHGKRKVVGEVYLHGYMNGEAFDAGTLVVGDHRVVVLE